MSLQWLNVKTVSGNKIDKNQTIGLLYSFEPLKDIEGSAIELHVL